MHQTVCPAPVTMLPLVPAACEVEATASPSPKCSTCSVAAFCLPKAAPLGSDAAALDQLMATRISVRAGDTVYCKGDPFHHLYAVWRGTFKTSVIKPRGREQVTGFHLTGDLMGFDGVAEDVYRTTATALEDGEVCAISYPHLQELTLGAEGLHGLVGQLMSRQIVRENSLLMLLGTCDAAERLAAFILNLSTKLAARGFSSREFHLRMSRSEIGSYLGLKLETVSRTFSQLQRANLLEVSKRHITIPDVERLTRAFELRIAT